MNKRFLPINGFRHRGKSRAHSLKPVIKSNTHPQ